MELTLETISPTLAGCGEPTGVIDSDAVFDDLGLPFIPARRIKGLLRESALEILEMLSPPGGGDLLAAVFGRPGLVGGEQGKAEFADLRLPGYERIRAWLEAETRDPAGSLPARRWLLSRDNLITAHAALSQQTALESDGVARNHSLRTSRALRPDLRFAGAIGGRPLDRRETALLCLAAVNLRRLGMHRNRGWGRVECRLAKGEVPDYEAALRDLASAESGPAGEETAAAPATTFPVCAPGASPAPGPAAPAASPPAARLPFAVTLLSPVIITRPRGEQNTVATREYLPGTLVRGLLAGRFIRARGLGKNAHCDNSFQSLFLDDRLIFGPAWPAAGNKAFHPAPLSLHAEKGAVLDPGADTTLYDLLGGEPDPEVKTRILGGFVREEADKVEKISVRRRFFFHNARSEDRAAGHSEEGGIFYYESLDAGQHFAGCLRGPEDLLNLLQEAVSPAGAFEATAGRSRTAQYGRVAFRFGTVAKEEENHPAEPAAGGNGESGTDRDRPVAEFRLTALSPLLFYNRNTGFPEVSDSILREYLQDFLGVDPAVDNAFAAAAPVESFLGVWKCRTPRETAFQEGSVFHLRVNGGNITRHCLRRLEATGLGEKRALGFGRVRVDWLDGNGYAGRKYAPPPAAGPGTAMPCEMRPLLGGILETALTRRLEAAGAADAASRHRPDAPLPNHLIGRLEALLISASDHNAFRKALDNFKEKPAGRKLQDQGLWQKLRDTTQADTKINDLLNNWLNQAERNWFDRYIPPGAAFGFFRAYWLAFFRTLRRCNKG